MAQFERPAWAVDLLASGLRAELAPPAEVDMPVFRHRQPDPFAVPAPTMH